MSTTDALLSCGAQAPGQTCDDVVTLRSPENLLPLGIAAVIAAIATDRSVSCQSYRVRRTALIVSSSAVVLLLTGCARNETVAANIALQFPDSTGLFFGRLYGPTLLALLAITDGVVVIVTLLAAFRAARAGRPVRRWPVVVSVILTALLVVVAVVTLLLQSFLFLIPFQ